MSRGPRALFEAVRAACSPSIWSRGVELVRAAAVLREGEVDDGLRFRVVTRGAIACRVTLFVDDEEWECDCAASEPACAHVAAAAIAWNRGAADEQAAAPPVGEGLRVGYRFRRLAGGLGLDRVVLDRDGERPLVTTLTVASRRVDGSPLVLTQEDLAAELALGTHRRGLLPPNLVPRVFRALARATEIRLDDRPVTVAGQPLLPRAVLEDQGDGFRLYLARDLSIEETFANGIARCGSVLRPLSAPRLTAREREELDRGLHFGPADAALLVTEVLPGLEGRLAVDQRTRRLPESVVLPPRVQVDTAVDGAELSVLATLVYGDPPRARVDAGRLVHLEGGIPLRDEQAEARLTRRLAAELGLAPGVRASFIGEQAVAFNARLSNWEGAVSGAARSRFEIAPPLAPRVTIDGERFDVWFECETADPSRGRSKGRGAAGQDVVRAWREGASLVPLTGGGWAPLPADWLARHGSRVADLLAARDAAGKLPRAAWLDLAQLAEALEMPVPPTLGALRARIEGLERIPAAELPADLTATLRCYQRSGVDWLALLRDAELGALLADDMGLGKTLQALCALSGRTLVVAPTSVLYNWVEEARRYRPGLRVSVFHGPRRELDPTAELTLTTYAILRLDVERLAAERWDSVVLDESQNIKNPDSQVAAAAFRLQGRFRIALTGTPIENRLEELWSQFRFTNPGLLGERRAFAEGYADPIGAGDDEAAARLRRRIRPFLLRRLKREVAAELPPRTEMVLRAELSDEERAVYDAVRAATLGEVVRKLDAGGGVIEALEALLRLRQAACHAGLVPGQQAETSSKLELLAEMLDSVVAEGHKALVFSQWTSFLDRVAPRLARSGLEYLRLDGSTRDRGEVVRRFQDPGGPPILLISLKAGGTGLNLTAADHVFLLDPWWNPAVEDQAADRAHRIGQERPVMVYRLVASGTVEERILDLQRHKRGLADAALAGAAAATSLTRDDLLALLS